MYIYNEVIKNIPGVAEICAAEEAWRKAEAENPNKENKELNPEVVGPDYYGSDDPLDFHGVDDLSEYMTADETSEYMNWWNKSLELYKAFKKTEENYPYAQKAISLDLDSHSNPTEGTIWAIAMLNAGADYKAVLDQYEANPGYPADDMTPKAKIIPLKQYAEQLGKNPANARQLARRGSFRTAQKIGRDWFVDANEPWPDRRVKSGKYIDMHQKYYKKSSEDT